jgi:hypothetical protein
MTGLPENLPKELSTKQWRANKGLFTKAVSDATGMGTALDKLAGAWTAVPWTTVDPDQAMARAAPTGDVTLDLVDKLEPLAQPHQAKVEAVKKELRAVDGLAKKTGDSWKANKLVPASSIKYVGQVHLAAMTLAKQLDELDEGWKAFRFNAQRGRVFRTDKAIIETEIRGAIASLRADTRTAQTNPSLAASLKDYRQMLVSIRKSVEALSKSNVKAHQGMKAILEPLLINPYTPKTNDEAKSDEALAQVARVAAALRKIKD